MNKRLLAGALVVSSFAMGAPSYAQSDEDKLRDQLRQTVLQLRELQDSQATLQAQKTAAEQERDALKAQLATAQGEVQKARHGSAESNALQQSLDKYKDAYSQATGSVQQANAERDKTKALLEGATAQLTECESKNIELIRIGNEILDAYRDVGIADVLAAGEPFVGLKRVELQNAAQDYGDRVYDGKYDPNTAHQSTPAKPNL